MADSGAGPSSNTPKVIPSLAKKQGDVTRLGTQKLKFVPTLPARRKKEDVKQEEPPTTTTEKGSRSRGRGSSDRGSRGSRGRGGEGRGSGPRPPQVEMTASGPFSMGPALAGTSARRTAPRSNFIPIVSQGQGGSAMKLGVGLTGTVAPSIGGGGAVKRENDLSGGDREKERLMKMAGEDADDEGEVYSDPDEGVEIVDMEDVRTMDWMAPDSLRKDKEGGKKKKKVKNEETEEDVKGKGVAKPEMIDLDGDEEKQEKINVANALNLSESEDEEEIEDIVDDFALHPDDMDDDLFAHRERLYFFQFPQPFPTFLSHKPLASSTSTSDEKDQNTEGAPTVEDTTAKKVTFAQDTKPPVEPTTPTAQAGVKVKTEPQEKTDANVDGIIGQLEVYQSGAVKMRLGNGIVLDVTAATQPSFLQHAVYLDQTNKRLCVLGEVNRRFVISPDMSALLAGMEMAERPVPNVLEEDGLIQMDTA